MEGRDAGRRLLACLISLCLLAGCGAGKSPMLSPTPVTFEPVTLVTGTHQCPGLNPDWTQDPDGTWQVRDVTPECTDTTDDPRVSGTHTASGEPRRRTRRGRPVGQCAPHE